MKLNRNFLLLAGLVALLTTCLVIWRFGSEGEVIDPGSDPGEGAELSAPKSLENVSVVGGLRNWKELDDPLRDGWESEVLHELVKKKLAMISGLVTSGQVDRGVLSEVALQNIEASVLVPVIEEESWRGGGVAVKRIEIPEKVASTDLEGLTSALQMIPNALGGEAKSRRCSFKVVTLRAEKELVRARVLIECARVDQAGVVEQHGDWITTWKRGGSGKELMLSEVLLQRFEQSEGEQRLFADCTESILKGNDSYRRQILLGYPYWLKRIQDTRQMTLLGTPGAALGDVNGDGLEDLYLCQPGGLPNRLYVQQPNGSLTDFTEESGTGWVESCRSALLVDLDNDGDQDLVVASYARMVVSRNDGKGRFSIEGIMELGIGAMGVSAADYDNDGDLDLYVCHYSKGDLDLEAGATVIGSGGQFVYHDANNAGRNYLYRNESEAGSWAFRDVTAEVGLDGNNRRFSLAAGWEDFDNDGDQDLYVANDFGRNNLYRNDNGKFVDIAPEVQGEDRASGMSVSWGDADRDGVMDLYVANMFSAAGNRIAPQADFSPGSSEETKGALLRFARGNTLLLQKGGRFQDASEELGVTMGRWAWSSMFADINNDGWDDLLVANGYITTPDTGDL